MQDGNEFILTVCRGATCNILAPWLNHLTPRSQRVEQ